MTAVSPRHRMRLKHCAAIEMGQSPPSARYSSLPEDGLPFLQGTADFGPESPSPRVYCELPTKVARAGDILLSVRAPVGALNLANQDVGIGRGLCAIRSAGDLGCTFCMVGAPRIVLAIETRLDRQHLQCSIGGRRW